MTRLLALAIAGLACLGLLPASAAAHPLGNFTTNQLVQVRIDSGEARVAYVLDQAEIPSFQQLQRFDADGDGAIAGGERAPLIDELLAEIEPGLGLTADGREVSLGEAADPELSFPPGQGGLTLTRLETSFSVRLPEQTERVEVTNDAFDGRVGWRAIQVLPGEGTDVASSVPATDPTSRLTNYPTDVLNSPPSDTSASFEIRAGSGAVSAPEGETAEADGGSRSSDGFADALAGGDTRGLLILVLLASAFGWGALHALSPGHGKAMVAGYLAGSRGTPRHAAVLGLTVTATHTISVFALGLITLLASEYIVPERLYPWLGVASGAMVIAIGFTVMRQRFRRWRAARAEVAEAHDRDHHHHGHGHHHHGHGHSGETGTERAPIRARELLGLGVSGGIVPCPSALVVLIAAISQHRIGLGLILIVAFSVGLAATVTGIGLATIWSGRLIRRLRPEQRLFGGRVTGAMPALSASLIVAVGVLITYRAIPELG
jgi:nickel/cobalt exporter